ncbi:hypothetical protein AMTRI_Chr02g263630 [Amborella trichopoda]
MVFRVFLCCFIFAISVSFVTADSIQGCGGFVEAHSSLIKSRKLSDGKLDYSHITVELLTIDGLVKDRTQCAPNGYYFIPVYDKGNFVINIKGPDGWSWEPDKVPVVVDHNGCNSNVDINFQLTGFTLSGRVVGAVGGESCSSKNGAPSNVKVELLSPDGDTVSVAFTSSTGGYCFTNITPGNYQLRASHPDLELEVRGSAEVELGFGNGKVDDIFFARGYVLNGFVVAQGNPILGVHIYLHSDDVLEVSCPQGSGDAPWPKNALCHAVSDKNGRFTFNFLPCGVYKLLPYYKGENTVFAVSPPSIDVTVDHFHVTVPQKFQVTGFSIGGRVVDHKGIGVEAVKIIVDGHEKCITDAQGYYKLDQVTSTHYTITAEKNHCKFNGLESIKVLPNMASLPDIKATHYDLCGMVRLVNADYKAKVALTHGPANVKPQVKQMDENGNFCFEVLPGEYRLSALAIASESTSGIHFVPPHIDVVVDMPLLDVEFSQAQVNIHGTVVCKEKCRPRVFISLVSVGGRNSGERKTIFLGDESSNFMFPKVLPGKYHLEVKHESSSDMQKEDDWCWDQQTIDVEVGTEDQKGIVFVQKGYLINIMSTHEVDSYILQPETSPLNLHIQKGSQQICVESPGLHELHFVNSCIHFGISSLKFDTLKPLPIYLTAQKYLVRGEIQVDPTLCPGAFELSERFIVDILRRDDAVVDVSHVRHVSNEDESGSYALYEYSVWANLGDELIFSPRDASNNIEKKFLFYPRKSHVTVATDGCQTAIAPFVGRLGLYIEGSVSPPILGVNIRIIASGDSSNTPLQKGELALETSTGSDGLFSAGPLYDDTSYVIEASRSGYHLKQVGPHSFSCQKLSQIVVHINSGEENTELFPPVLLSLSGEDGYRNNSISGAGGLFIFENLFPGSFYLRPLLKEYSFSPAAQAIELGSGESREVFFHANRVAYSAMGTVSFLSGQPKEGVFVEAKSQSKGYYEVTSSDSLGFYRLRGLLPNTTYMIKVVAKEDPGGIRIERASPDGVAIEVGYEDVKGVDFIIFEQPEMTILSGHVKGVGLEELQPHLSVQVKSATDPSVVVAVLPLPLSFYFQIRDLPKGRHLVQLISGLSSSAYVFKSEIFEFDLEKHTQIHVGPLTYKLDERNYKTEVTPAPAFPLIVGMAVIALFISMPRLKDLYQWAAGIAPSGSLATAPKKEVRKPIIRKRTY